MTSAPARCILYRYGCDERNGPAAADPPLYPRRRAMLWTGTAPASQSTTAFPTALTVGLEAERRLNAYLVRADTPGRLPQLSEGRRAWRSASALSLCTGFAR